MVLKPASKTTSIVRSRLVIIRDRILARGRLFQLQRPNIQQPPKEHHGGDREWKREIARKDVVRSARQILSKKPGHREDRDKSSGIPHNGEQDWRAKDHQLLPKAVHH